MPTRSYSINHAIGGDNWQGGNGVAIGQPVNGPTSARFSKIPLPSATLFFVESPSYWTGGARGRVEGNSYSRCPLDQSVGITYTYTYNLTEWQPGVAPHTRDTFNYAFVDGHIASMYPTESDGQYVWPGHPNGIIYNNTWANGDAVGFWSLNPND
jgi:prepilin-type processing-associated H-X9-DG protein